MIQHVVSNVETSLAGDTATVRAAFSTHMVLPGRTDLSYCGGYYHHDVVRTPDGRRSVRLVEENVWFVGRGETP